jgi:hypothetical protein
LAANLFPLQGGRRAGGLIGLFSRLAILSVLVASIASCHQESEQIADAWGLQRLDDRKDY